MATPGDVGGVGAVVAGGVTGGVEPAVGLLFGPGVEVSVFALDFSAACRASQSAWVVRAAATQSAGNFDALIAWLDGAATFVTLDAAGPVLTAAG